MMVNIQFHLHNVTISVHWILIWSKLWLTVVGLYIITNNSKENSHLLVRRILELYI